MPASKSCQTPFFDSSKFKKEENDASPSFISKLPTKPYCCDNLAAGLKIRNLETALKFRYIQFNHLVANFLVFDIDRPGAALAFEESNLASPNLAVINRNNQHAHLIYFLAKGVSKFSDSSLKALKYLAAIEAAYTARLGADAGYAGLIAKNPISPFWQVWQIHNRQYDLSELADYVDLKTAKKEQILLGFGRNCDLFENGRNYAYKAVRDYRKDKTYQDFFQSVFIRLNGLNRLFFNPLPLNEIVSITKSIVKWTLRQDGQAERAFIERQQYKGILSGQVRQKIASAKKDKAIELKTAGFCNYAIARKLGISSRQIYRYFNIT